MKKIILAVILMAAAGGISYYLLQKNERQSRLKFNKEFIIGKWAIDSMVTPMASSKDSFALQLYDTDSNFRKQIYELQPGGQVLISISADSLRERDTSSFAWGKHNEFIWKQKIIDDTADTMTVIKLDKNEFILRTRDSTLVYLKRVK